MKTITSIDPLVKDYSNLDNNEVLVCLHDCRVGIATKGIKGYKSTPYKVAGKYQGAKQFVELANKVIHPDKSGLDFMEIVMTTL